MQIEMQLKVLVSDPCRRIDSGVLKDVLSMDSKTKYLQNIFIIIYTLSEVKESIRLVHFKV